LDEPGSDRNPQGAAARTGGSGICEEDLRRKMLNSPVIEILFEFSRN